MRKIQYIIYVAFALLFAACQEEDFDSGAKGGIRISLTEEVGVDVTTRSTPEELGKPVAANFKFKITDNTGATENYDYTDKVIPLSAGTYDVVAYCGDIATTVALDAPYYEGSAEATVEDGKTTNVKLSCKVANALLSIQINEDDQEKFEAAFPDAHFKLSLSSGEGETLSDISQSFYFPAGSTISKLAFSKDGSDYQDLEIKNWPKEIKAADHIIVTVGIQPAPSGVSLTVEKMKVETVTIEETIPMEWLPKPKMAVEGFDATTKMLSMYESETPTAKFNFNLSSGLQELKFTLDFKDEEYKSLNKAYTLSELSQEDRTALTNAGVVLPAIGDKSKVSLDFSGLAAKLTGSTDGNALDNVITLTEVKANNRVLEGGEQTYTIQTHAPEFGIKVYPGNTWTKQFTANTEITKGNAEVIRKGMTFEYSTNGSDWTSSDSIVTGLTPGTAYQVRAKFGKHVTEVAKVSTYPVIELENGNLSDYSIVRGEDGDRWNGHGAQYEWTNWTTLNELTTPNCPITAYSYNTRSGTRPVPDVRPNTSDNTAAWIITIGYGYGGTNDSPNKITPSELVYDKTWENATRPTGVHFWYKYAPFKEDKSDISVIVYSGEQIVGSGTLQEAQTVSSYSQEGYTLNIIYDSEYKQLDPNRVLLTFRSGFNTEVESRESGGLVTSTTANPKFRGSELYIDDISLVYDK